MAAKRVARYLLYSPSTLLVVRIIIIYIECRNAIALSKYPFLFVANSARINIGVKRLLIDVSDIISYVTGTPSPSPGLPPRNV
jgi:hypothetical protein